MSKKYKKWHKQGHDPGYSPFEGYGPGGGYGYGSPGYGHAQGPGQWGASHGYGGPGYRMGSSYGGPGMDPAYLQGLSAYLPPQHTEQFLLGLLIGAGATWVLSDEKMRAKLIRSAMKIYSSLADGFEEMKEQMSDIRAEVDTERHEED